MGRAITVEAAATGTLQGASPGQTSVARGNSFIRGERRRPTQKLSAKSRDRRENSVLTTGL